MSTPVIDHARPLGLKRHLQPHVVPNEGVYLVSEGRVSVLDGTLATRLTPLLDGTRTLPEIRRELAGTVSGERVDAAVSRLMQGGIATHVDPGSDRRTAAFFDYAGVDGDAAVQALRAATVSIRTFGAVDPRPLENALAALGIQVSAGQPGALVVALTDDYLQPGLADVNAEALRTQAAWMIARPTGATAWVGPLFTPETGCWQCLSSRIAANRQSLTYLQQRLDRSAPFSTAEPCLPVTPVLGAQLIAAAVAGHLAGVRTPEPAVLTFDTLTMRTEVHELVRRPQCPACGNPALMAEQGLRPVRIGSQRKVFTGDGGHRSTTPEQMLETYKRQLSPITGVVTGLIPANNTPDGLRVYVTGQNLSRQAGNLRTLRRGLRSLSAGKGKTDAQAKASALGEAMERYSGVFQGDELRRWTSLDALGDSGIHPNSSMLFSQDQYRRRGDWQDDGSVTASFHAVPEPFDPSRETDFSPVHSLTQDRTLWLPTSSLYFATPSKQRSAQADSNGNAAGTSLEDAVLQGFLELVERDAVALWWYNRVQRPAVDMDSFGDPYVDQLRDVYRRQHREVWALDLTTDLGIPVVGAFSRRLDKPAEDILIAFGAHLDPHIALTRALTEMNQFLGSAVPLADGSGGYQGSEPDQEQWWRTATLANQPYLQPHPGLPISGRGSWPELGSDDLADDIAMARRLVEDRGMQMLILDQTRPDVGLPVVKVIVPGMRHFWRRNAPGRLYDVPVQLGWLDKPKAEADLNPIAVFI